MKKKLLTSILILIIIYILYKIFFDSTAKNTFPFSKADNIELLFYKQARFNSDLKKIARIPIKKKVKLNENEKEEIFEILFKENCFIQSSAACYDPRHAILFTKQNDTIGIIEMCLECSQIRVTEGIEQLKMCDGKIEKLEKFFKSKE